MSHNMSSLFTHRNGTALNKALRMPCMRKCAHHRSKTYLRNQIRNCVLYKCLFVHCYYISPPTPGFLFECLQKKLSLRKRAAQKLNKYWRECAPHIFNQSIYLYLRQQNTSLVCKSTQSNIGIVILHVNDSLCNLTNTNIWIEENWTVKYKMFLHQTQKLDSR